MSVYLVKIILISLILLYGAVNDYKAREIPNAVPIFLIVVGLFFDFSLIPAIINLVIAGLIFLLANKLTKGDLPGGDFKLLCTLSFATNLLEVSAVMLLTGIGTIFVGLIKKQHINRHIPLCSYVAPSYILLQGLIKGVVTLV